MVASEPVNILLVDDQPARLLSYEDMLGSLGENLIRASSGNEALDQLLKRDIAVILMDVCMPESDGFELSSMIRNHPRFHKTAIIHVSAVNLTDIDRLRGDNSGAVDYVSVPVVPAVLRAKVKIFADLYRKTEELKQLNAELELRVAERTAQLEATVDRLRRSEERFRVMAETVPSFLWTADANGAVTYVNQRWFEYSGSTPGDLQGVWFSGACHPDDHERCREEWARAVRDGGEFRSEARLRGKDGGYRWFLTHALPQKPSERVSGWFGVSTDIQEQKINSVELGDGEWRKDTRAEREASRDAHAAVVPLRILVADDSADSTEALAVLLRLAGHEVQVAHDGEEALALAQSFRPDVALLDIGMSHTNGCDLARKLRDRPWGRDIRLIAATGWGQEDDRRRTREAGFEAHLVKPVDSARLLELLSSLRPVAARQA